MTARLTRGPTRQREARERGRRGLRWAGPRGKGVRRATAKRGKAGVGAGCGRDEGLRVGEPERLGQQAERGRERTFLFF